MFNEQMFDYIEEDGITLISSYDETKIKGIMHMITFPEKTPDGKIIKGIKSFTFIDCKFHEIIIPKTYDKIEDNAFVSCTKLEKVKLNGEIPENLSRIFSECRDDICFFVNSIEDVKDIKISKGYCFFLGELDFSKVKYSEDVRRIIIEDISKFIKDRVDVYIPNTYKGKKVILNLRNIYEYFTTDTGECYAEKSFDKLKTVEYLRISNFNFHDADKIYFENLKAINLGSNTRLISVPKFPVKRLTIPDKTEILVFFGDKNDFINIEELYLPNSLRNFNLKVLKDTRFMERYLDKKNNLYIIDNYLIGMKMSLNNPSEIKIPKEVEFISKYAFDRVDIKSIEFNNKIKEIPEKCFFNCRNLSKVFLPENIEKINSDAFAKTYLIREDKTLPKVSYFIKNKKCKISAGAFNFYENNEVILG